MRCTILYTGQKVPDLFQLIDFLSHSINGVCFGFCKKVSHYKTLAELTPSNSKMEKDNSQKEWQEKKIHCFMLRIINKRAFLPPSHCVLQLTEVFATRLFFLNFYQHAARARNSPSLCLAFPSSHLKWMTRQKWL